MKDDFLENIGKAIADENTPPAEPEKVNPQEVYEENDNWQFEAEALTLKETSLESDDIAIDIPAEKPSSRERQKKPELKTKVQSAPVRKSGGNTALFIFIGVFVAACIIALGILGNSYYNKPNSSEKMNPGNVAMVVGDTEVSLGMYNYYYSAISQNYINYADYYGLDASTDFSKQSTTTEDGKNTTWAKRFVSETVEQVQYITALYEKAVNAGVTLTEDQKTELKEQLSSIKEAASESDMSVDEYVSSIYGDYCGYATVKKMAEQCYVAQNYYQQYSVETKVTDEEIKAYYKEHKSDYMAVSFAYLQIVYDGETLTQSQAEKTAKKYSEKIKTVEDVKKYLPKVCDVLIEQYINYGYFEDEESAVETLSENVEASFTKNESSLPDAANEWLFSNDVNVGTASYFTDTDNCVVYILLKTSKPTLDKQEVYSVRHILVMPEADETEEDEEEESTATEYTQEQWDAAKKEAEKILNEYNKGDKSEYSFALLAEEYTDDTESTSKGSSGLYGGLYAGTSLGEMVPTFEEWATDKSRKYGDVDIVESDYGYHIMYFVNDTQKYLYECESAVLMEKEDQMVKETEVKKHSSVLAKAKVAEPTAADDSSDMDY